MKAMIKIAALLLAAVGLGTGCTSLQPLSNYARTGDTVTVALGGSSTVALSPVVKKENVKVSITDASGVTYPVKVRYVFKTYSDPASAYAYRDFQNINDFATTDAPYQGQWMAVIDLVDPDTGTPPPLAEGMAHLGIRSPDLKTYLFGQISWSNGDLSSVPIDILAGTGHSNPLNYMDSIAMDPLLLLEPLPEIQVSPKGTPLVEVGGGEFVLSYVNADFQRPPKVIPSTPDTNVQILSNAVDQGNGTSLLKVVVMNQHGFRTNDERDDTLNRGKSPFGSLVFGVIWDQRYSHVVDATWENSLHLVSGAYFDVDGKPMTELSAQVSKVR